MHTGSWWWEIQVSILQSIQCEANRTYQTLLEARKPGASVIPVIVATDVTQLTVFGNKTAYPLYLTIGNIPKAIRNKPSRRGQVLLTYLPTSKLSSITNKAARRRMVANLFHACLQRVLSPLVDVGIEGMPMSDGFGTMHQVHPILAVYVGDYPEQVLVTGIKTRDCPKCDVPPTELGNCKHHPISETSMLSSMRSLNLEATYENSKKPAKRCASSRLFTRSGNYYLSSTSSKL